MAVKLRLSRQGRKKAPFYYIVAADSRSPRDGKFIEKLGSYNPLTVPATIELNADRAFEWLMNGAQATDTVNAILRFKGVNYKKHLQLGVAKGKLTQDEADAKLAELVSIKNARLEARKQKSADEKAAYWTKVSGTAKAVAIAPAATEDREAFQVTEETTNEVVESETNQVEEAPEVIASEESGNEAVESAEEETQE
jgi:small subunit ribosomal protein S16